MKYYFFTLDGISLPVAYKLQQEGNEVIVGMVQDQAELQNNDKPEDPEKKRKRLSLYSGIFDIKPASELLKQLLAHKEDARIICDFNSLWVYGEALEKAGYIGFFPKKEDHEFEADREKAKEFVKQNYPDIKVAEVNEFKSTEDAKKFLEDAENIYVLKGNSDEAKTIVPETDDIDMAKEMLISALDEYKTDYEKKGFILEQKIINPIEFTPEIQFFNGVPVMTTVDIENKPLGAENKGVQTGCSQNLVVKTELEDKINKIAFPPKVFEMAKERKGLFVWDISILYDGKDYYFGEFCPQRWGWDAFITELKMCESVSSYFDKVFAGENPLVDTFGVAVRAFVVREGGVPEEVEIEGGDNCYIYDLKLKGKKMTTGYTWDTLVAVGSGEDINTATLEAYEEMDKNSFAYKYRRPMFDFLSTEYPDSIPNRYIEINHKLFNAPDLEPMDNNADLIRYLKQSIRKEVEEEISKYL
jgi:HEPN domain-containing protein